jgi:glycosyltransferase involved in cell wall biosynthesis
VKFVADALLQVRHLAPIAMPPEKTLPPGAESPLKIAYLTAGAAGMICGSCMHDNTLARALLALGHDVQLIPLYTPIRTDEEDVSLHTVFYGGINMYLQQKLSLFRWLPKWLDRWLDQPWLINWAAGRSVKIDPQQVADLALSVLRGREGLQRKEVERLADWLTAELKPDVIVFSNILTAGCVPEIKRRMNVPVVVTLQGDDIFLRGLPEPYQSQALAQISLLAESIDGFIANSRFYADAMADYLRLDRERIAIVPLGIDAHDFTEANADRGTRNVELNASDPHSAFRVPRSALAPTIGYLARLSPEKGLHVLADAFIKLRQRPGMESARLRIAGWLGEKNRAYAEGVFDRLRAAGLGDGFEYVGEVDRRGKLDFLASLDVLAVPTTYREPKGLFVLEALAAGVPVVQPDHGAFPEMLASTAGGLLHRPEDPDHLAERLHELLSDANRRQLLATTGQRNVHSARNAETMAARTVQVLRETLERSRSMISAQPARPEALQASAVERA